MSDRHMVNINELDKAAVLAVLFNGSAPGGMGFLQAGNGPSVMTVEDAERVIDNGGSPDPGFPRGNLSYDYLFGRPLKVNLEKDEFDPWGFDRDNGGTGTAQRLIAELRSSGQVNSDELSDHRKGLLLERYAQTNELVKTPSSAEGNTFYLGGDDVADIVTHHRDQQVKRSLQEG